MRDIQQAPASCGLGLPSCAMGLIGDVNYALGRQATCLSASCPWPGKGWQNLCQRPQKAKAIQLVSSTQQRTGAYCLQYALAGSCFVFLSLSLCILQTAHLLPGPNLWHHYPCLGFNVTPEDNWDPAGIPQLLGVMTESPTQSQPRRAPDVISPLVTTAATQIQRAYSVPRMCWAN